MKRYRVAVFLTASGLILLVSILVFEVLARVAFHYKDEINAGLYRLAPSLQVTLGFELAPYQVLDPSHGVHRRLKPGFSQTLAQALASRAGKPLSVKVLQEEASRLGVQSDEVIFQINQDGFKGPEIDHSHSKFRILSLGDSCTFGSIFDRDSYPRTLESELRRRGFDVEVINGAVEGYNPQEILLRIQEYQALKPDLTAVYIGWNQIFGPKDTPTGSYAWRLLQKMVHKVAVLWNPHGEALAQYRKPKAVSRAVGEVPREPIDDIERIVRAMQQAGSRVVLLTLPGLYVMEQGPDSAALEIGHLPTYTDNPFVLAKVTAAFNQDLKTIAEQAGAGLIDLDRWSRAAFLPRSAHFTDAVHLRADSQRLMGIHLADELQPLLTKDPSL